MGGSGQGFSSNSSFVVGKQPEGALGEFIRFSPGIRGFGSHWTRNFKNKSVVWLRQNVVCGHDKTSASTTERSSPIPGQPHLTWRTDAQA